ncbi:hypothetical protein DOTSEDRAFT_118263 [Dothistroma septosporum NZE10]|uniref:Uncharacterized protein n=1 Tax=Dothistroma septosporum (strain NZE10 / CBS 128990) TaxID=675120 RepID=N1Q1T1_DOTSN|nr:hypothetical protein DOTSEDRAFT_118263 [Dothistroma septosporum NZE10]
MPPKKNRPQASQTAASTPQRHTRSSVTPQPEAARQTRAGGRKRRRSDASEQSEQSQQSAATPGKRRRRGKVATEADKEHDQLHERPDAIPEEAEEYEADDDIVQTAVDVELVETTEEHHTSRHVRFGDGDATHEESTISLHSDDRGTATQMTPHPAKGNAAKLAIKRRRTGSPATNGHSHDKFHSQQIKRSTVLQLRHSLPPTLSQEEEQRIRALYRLAPLTEVIRERVARLRRLEVLRSELREHQINGNAIEARETQEQIDALEQEDRDAAGHDVDTDGDDMLVLQSQQEISYPALPRDSTLFNFSQSVAEDSKPARDTLIEEVLVRQSQTRSSAAGWEEERAAFHTHIEALSRQANTAKDELNILRIELEGLGIGAEGADAFAVLSNIREIFLRTRERLERILPDSIPENASNEDIIEILVANVSEFANRLRAQDEELYEQSTLTASLSRQVKGLLDRLAEAELRKQELHERFNELDQTNDSKEREIEDLEEERRDLEQQRDILQDELDAKEKDLEAVRIENVDFAKSISRLNVSLREYQEEASSLKTLVTTMEEEHRTTIIRMNREREETVRDLEDRLDEQTQLRTEAELLGDERQALITDLEVQIATVEAECDTLREQLTDVTAQRDEEQNARDAAEADLQQRGVEVEALEDRVERLELQLSELTKELDELRQLNETERKQREAAENDLDDRNAEIEELNEKIREQGKQGNELRQKLFEIQQTNQMKVRELEQAASERDEQYQTDIAAEVQRRETQEELVQERAATILDLEARIEEIENEMTTLLSERDERIEALDAKNVQNDREIETLRNDLQAAEDLYDTEVTQRRQEREELKASIAALQITISEHELQITHLRDEATVTSDLHNSEIDDRNTRIAGLNHEVAEKQAYVNALEEEKLSLERRVEQEATAMLQLDADRGAEIDHLKSIINEKQEKILNVEDKAHKADAAWLSLVQAREAEIAELKSSDVEQTETIATLEAETSEIRAMMAKYVEDTTAEMQDLRDEIAALNAKAGKTTDSRQAAGQELLGRLETMSAFRMTTTTTTTTKSAQTEQRSLRKTRGRGFKDSAIGAELEESMTSS